MYLPFMDYLLAELNIRLISSEPRFCAQHLLPTKAAQLDEATEDTIFDAYSDDMTLSKRCLRMWKSKLANGESNIPKDVQEIFNITNKNFYSGIYIVLCIFACMPVSTATTERSFNTMRRVTTYLRNSMSRKRLSGLGLLNVYREKESVLITYWTFSVERRTESGHFSSSDTIPTSNIFTSYNKYMQQYFAKIHYAYNYILRLSQVRIIWSHCLFSTSVFHVANIV